MGEKVGFRELMVSGWEPTMDVGSMPLREVAYDLGGMCDHTFSNLFPIYDWTADRGHDNIGSWIEAAALMSRR